MCSLSEYWSDKQCLVPAPMVHDIEHDDKHQKVHRLLGICSSAVFLLVHVLHTVILLECMQSGVN